MYSAFINIWIKTIDIICFALFVTNAFLSFVVVSIKSKKMSRMHYDENTMNIILAVADVILKCLQTHCYFEDTI